MINALIEMSNRYGSDEQYVLIGGGNTSFKQDNIMYVKGSGTSLGTIKEEGFVRMDTKAVLATLSKDYPADDDAREAAALADMMAAKLPGEEHKRPSVEALLHALFPYTYVLHVHPPLVNGLSCSLGGEALCKEMFGDKVVWIDLIKPGYILGRFCYEALGAIAKEKGSFPQILILQNHGIFIAADTIAEIDEMMADVMAKLSARVEEAPNLAEVPADSAAYDYAPALRMLYGKGAPASAVFCAPAELISLSASEESMKPLLVPFSPDHIVYCKASPLYLTIEDDIAEAFAAFEKKNGYTPKIAVIRGVGFFAMGLTRKEAEIARVVFLDAVKIAAYSKYFGGALNLPQDFVDFILNWEVESYRQKTALAQGNRLRMDKKICIVTGAAQGFGRGIAEGLAAEGAYVVIADMNLQGAQACADDICKQYGPQTALALAVNVTDEESVEQMVRSTVLYYGGLDVIVSNAGIVISGSLSEMTKAGFEKVSAVNYTGYFLSAKYASIPMKIQHQYAPEYSMDIIEINSKSGLQGSNKNFAYAGSKFGGVGLTQSFAMELVTDNIKVNAVCPGNLLDGPLWSDPERGLFRQYLDAGKVPGAKTIEDVRKFYEAKVPMGRGCTVPDVVRGILYLCEQQYETGQALPVTGGQVMLK